MMAKLVRACVRNPSNDLIDALMENSNAAVRRFEQFRHFYERYQVVSFYEGLPYGKVGIVCYMNLISLLLQRHC